MKILFKGIEIWLLLLLHRHFSNQIFVSFSKSAFLLYALKYNKGPASSNLMFPH